MKLHLLQQVQKRVTARGSNNFFFTVVAFPYKSFFPRVYNNNE